MTTQLASLCLSVCLPSANSACMMGEEETAFPTRTVGKSIGKYPSSPLSHPGTYPPTVNDYRSGTAYHPSHHSRGGRGLA
ncbi:hypothetical protein LZ31DRAFT_559124 [Colletotrichum somersetense]|nr:hypothetical protein LZ31DRAFT_559124 [Colletotrichum somersetense]